MNPENLPPIQDRPNRTLKQYLGDGIYVCLDTETHLIELTTENGVEVQNVIVLGLEEANGFITWMNNLCELAKKQQKEG